MQPLATWKADRAISLHNLNEHLQERKLPYRFEGKAQTAERGEWFKTVDDRQSAAM